MRTLHAARQKFSLKYFREQLKIREIRETKDPRKFSAIRVVIIKKIAREWQW